MGVATGDPDNDGDLDIFMTAIRDENVDSSVFQYGGTNPLSPPRMMLSTTSPKKQIPSSQ